MAGMTKLDYEQVTGGFSEADKARISKFNDLLVSAIRRANKERERLVKSFLDDALGAGQISDVDDLGLVWA